MVRGTKIVLSGGDDMDAVQSFSTPVAYLIDLDGLGLVEGAKRQLRELSLVEIVLLTSNFTVSKNLNQVGSVKLELIKKEIEKTDEYQAVKNIIK